MNTTPVIIDVDKAVERFLDDEHVEELLQDLAHHSNFGYGMIRAILQLTYQRGYLDGEKDGKASARRPQPVLP